MVKSTRQYLKEPTTVQVFDFKKVLPGFGVLSFKSGDDICADLFNIPDWKNAKVLDLVRAGHKVEAQLTPDSSADSDGHPECVSVRLLS